MNPQTRIHTIIVMAFITVFLDSMNYALIVPILPYLVKELNSTSMEEGILFSSYSVFQLLSTIDSSHSFSRSFTHGSVE